MSIIGGLACALMLFLGIAHLFDCIVNGVTDVRAITVPKWTVFIIIPIGSLLLTLQFFQDGLGPVYRNKARKVSMEW